MLNFRASFARSRSRVEYLCNLFGKPFPKSKGWEQRTVKELSDYIDATPSDPKLFEKTLAQIRRDVSKYGIPVSNTDLETITSIHRAFYSAGLDIRYSSHHRPPPARELATSYAHRGALCQRDRSIIGSTHHLHGLRTGVAGRALSSV